jgi:hypothetical protein
MTKLVSIYNEVKKDFFPRWDNKDVWLVRRKNRLSYGYNTCALCNCKTKTIEIIRSYKIEDGYEIRCLLAHEICHAIYPGDHNKKWQKRLLKVADSATESGQQELANRIHSEIKIAKGTITATLPAITQNIHDALQTQPDASFESVIEFVADNWGYTTSGLMKRYKSLKKPFYKAKRDAISDRELFKKYNANH